MQDVKVVLEGLVRLQELDAELSRIEAGLAAGPRRLAEIERTLGAAKAELEAARERLQKSGKDRRGLESDVESVRAKISRHQTQMMAVKTNEEYRALTKEIEHERTMIENIEEKILLLMESGEELEAGVKEKSAALAEDERRVESEQHTVAQELERLQRDRKDIDKERAIVVASVPADAMALYDRVHGTRGGIAVAKVVGENCGVCRVRNRPQALAEAREFSRLVQCESCGRILAAPPLPPSTIEIHALVDDLDD